LIREHSVLGRAYGDADLAHDVRLACHGLDVNDNDFVIGLVGRSCTRCRTLVQAMRKTAQTSQYLATLGPSSSVTRSGRPSLR
jgi:chlorite dismutase